MALLNVRVLLSFSVICITAAAQNTAHQCEVPAAIDDLKYEQLKAGLPDHASDFHWLRRLIALAPQQPKPAPLAADFEKKLNEHPKDPAFIYLAAAALVGKDTPQAVVLLNRVAEADPAIPWTFATLAHIHGSLNFRDDAKLLADTRAYRKLCPANLDGFTRLDKFDDPAELAVMAQELRALLEKDSDPKHAGSWSKLWAAEFRLAPTNEHDKQRARVVADLKRLESMRASNAEPVFLALADGYRLTGRAGEAQALLDERYPDNAFQRVFQEWSRDRAINRRLSHDEIVAWAEDRAKASAEWIKKYPGARFAWQLRLDGIPYTPNWTKEQMEFAGEQVLKLEAARPYGWSIVPGRMRVAEAWARYGVRLKDCEAMGQSALDEILQGPEVHSDLVASKNQKEIDERGTYSFDSQVWEAMGLVLDTQAQLHEFDRAEHTLTKMRQWLDDNVAKQGDPSKGYMHFQGAYFYNAGLLAATQGHKLDAASLYAKAVSYGWSGPLVVSERPHQYWLEQGGTEEGWAVATKRITPPRVEPAKAPTTALLRAEGPSYWQSTSQPLREMNLLDAAGKTWTLANIKGKPTFLNVWAIWCEPCRADLPYIQKIYDLLKDRTDIQLVTLNLDDNPGEVAPYMAANHFTFPVLHARRYFEKEYGTMVLPQTWIVDKQGVIRQQSWFESRHPTSAELEKWPSQIVEKLARLIE